VFEITPKEQLLKNVRKGLVQPLSNKYPLLNFDKQLVKSNLLRTDESFIKSWIENGFYFAVFSGVFDLMNQINGLQDSYNLGIVSIDDKPLTALFIENELPYSSVESLQKTLCCGFSKLETTSNSLFFGSELHPIKYFSKCENLILFGKASQIEIPEDNKCFTEMMLKNDLKVQLPLEYFKQFNSVFLFIEE
jgi:hypothetical protein